MGGFTAVRKLNLAFITFTTFALGQNPAPNPAPNSPVTPQALSDAKKQGTPLPAQANVRDNVGVTAVLLPYNAVRRLFGADIAKTYAVVELDISNRSADAAFVIHSAYIDTEHWALGGGTKGQSAGTKDPNPSRAGTYAHQYASVEARVVRGQLLDAQMWTGRNWTVRLLTLAGSLASASTFAFREQGIVKGIGVFGSDFVPGVAAAWPDGTVNQLNRVSDFGFQTNKVIAKQNADIVLCFFPMNMFLSEPFRDIFIKAPGLFSSPYQILFTDQNKPYRETLNISDDLRKKAIKLHECYSKVFETPASKPGDGSLAAVVDDSLTSICKTQLQDSANTDTLELLAYIGRFGLQNISAFVDGIMTVDVDSIPATIDGVTFTGDPTQNSFWAAKATVKGSLQCRLCQNGKVAVTVTDSSGKTTTLVVDTMGATSSEVDFSFTVPDTSIVTGNKLAFTITKQPVDTTKPAVTSGSYTYTVPALSAAKN
jgi:hypothetical protein